MTSTARITGVGDARIEKGRLRRGVELGAEAALAAVADAGLALADVDALLVESPDVEQHHMAHLALCDTLGWTPPFALSTGAGGSTPFANVTVATSLLAAGVAERVLVVDYDARRSFRKANRERLGANLPRGGGHASFWEDPYGATGPAKFALNASAHMARYGTTRADLARVTVAARAAGAQRPGAQLREPVTLDDVLSSEPIAEPLHKLDCCLISDFGSAYVVSNVPGDAPGGVEILGLGQHHGGYAVYRTEEYGRAVDVERAAQQAFGQAGLSPGEVDVALVYDSFTITVLLGLEAIGFCGPGEGGAFLRETGLGPSGGLPLNPHGGQLSYSGGHGHFVTEAVRQLRGTAPSGQVPDAEVALCQGMAAGVLSAYTVLLGGTR